MNLYVRLAGNPKDGTHFVKWGALPKAVTICTLAALLLGLFSPPLAMGMTPVVGKVLAAPIESPMLQGGPNLLIDKSVNKPTPAAGESFIYTIRYRCASLSEHCFNASIEDVVPDDLVIAGYSRTGGNVSSASNVGNTITWNLESGVVPGRLDAGSTGLIRVWARFPACGTQAPAAGSTLSNVATFFEASGSVSSSANGADVTVPTIEACLTPLPDPTSDFVKRTHHLDVMPGTSFAFMAIDLPANPSATEPYVVTDILPPGMQILTMAAFNFISGGGGQQIDLLCNGIWYADAVGADLTQLQNGAEANCNTTEPLIEGAIYADIEGFRAVMSPGGQSSSLEFEIAVDADAPVDSVLRNIATLQEQPGVDVDGNGTPGEEVDASLDQNVVEPNPVFEPEKGIAVKPGYVDQTDVSILDGNGNLPATVPSPNGFAMEDLDLTSVYLAETDAVWNVFGTYGGLNPKGNNLVDPVIIDDLPPEFDFVQDAQTGNFVQVALLDQGQPAPYNPVNNPACLSPRVTVLDNYNGTGRDRVIVEFIGCTLYAGLKAEAILGVYISGRLKPGTPLGTSITNTGSISGSNGEQIRCGSGNSEVVEICSASASFTIPSLSGLESAKYVQGALDSQLHRFPNSGFTNLEGDAVYALNIDNLGNGNQTRIDVVDVLPYIGDTSLVSSGPRGSEWSEELVAPIVIERYDPNTNTWSAVPASDLPLGPYYTSSTNPCRLDSSGFELYVDEVQAVGPAGCDANPWTGLATAAAGARSFGFRFAPAVPLAPGQKLRIKVVVRQLTGEPDAPSGSIAWNSFAYGATYDDPNLGPVTLLATEPLKVGIEMIGPDTAALGDYVWLDINGDGMQGSSEAPIPGVRVTLYAADGVTPILDNAGNPRTTTTDSKGLYMFWGLTPDTPYVVRLDHPADYTPTGALGRLSLTQANSTADDLDSDATLAADGFPEISATTDAAGSETRTYDFGFFIPASVGDFVWDDLNQDGVQDLGEPGVPNITVNLLDADGNIVDTTTTNGSGGYLFDDLVPGVYRIAFDPNTLPANRIFTRTGTSGNPQTDSDARANGQTVQFVLEPGEHDPTWDAGLVPPPTDPAAITGRAWEDLNDDGQDNNGEPGVPGMEVQLVDGLGLPVATTTTDENGEYRFDNLVPNQPYQVVFNPSDGQTVTTQQNVGDDATDSDASPTTGETQTVTPGPNETIPDLDVGIISKLSLGNLVWFDANNNGLVDGAESGIAGVTVRLLDASNNPLATTTTDSFGKYVFIGLDAGNYRVEVDVPNGYVSSTDIASTGTPNQLDSDDNGIDPTGATMRSNLISLAATGSTAGQASLGESDHGKPINGAIDPTPDAKAYYTVDFGFVAISTITVVKQTLGTDGTFTFSSTDGDLDGLSISTVANTGRSAVITKPIGTYILTEDTLAAWTLTGITFRGDRDGDSSFIDTTAIIELDAGEHITVTFTNRENVLPSLSINKSLVNPTIGAFVVGEPIIFNLTIQNTGNITISDLSLSDSFDANYLLFNTASITPDSSAVGLLNWVGTNDGVNAGSGSLQNVLPLGPDDQFVIVVEFTAAKP